MVLDAKFFRACVQWFSGSGCWLALQQPDCQEYVVLPERLGLLGLGLENASVFPEVLQDGYEGGLVGGVQAVLNFIPLLEAS
jgi:hypothetical protein